MSTLTTKLSINIVYNSELMICFVSVACLKVVLSKGLGYGIILGSILGELF